MLQNICDASFMLAKDFLAVLRSFDPEKPAEKHRGRTAFS